MTLGKFLWFWSVCKQSVETQIHLQTISGEKSLWGKLGHGKQVNISNADDPEQNHTQSAHQISPPPYHERQCLEKQYRRQLLMDWFILTEIYVSQPSLADRKMTKRKIWALFRSVVPKRRFPWPEASASLGILLEMQISLLTPDLSEILGGGPSNLLSLSPARTSADGTTCERLVTAHQGVTMKTGDTRWEILRVVDTNASPSYMSIVH
jgi:hypothetical protein